MRNVVAEKNYDNRIRDKGGIRTMDKWPKHKDAIVAIKGTLEIGIFRNLWIDLMGYMLNKNVTIIVGQKNGYDMGRSVTLDQIEEIGVL